MVAKIVKPSRMEWAVKTFEPYKAPRPDGIYPILIQQRLQELSGPLMKILSASIDMRHIPKAWGGTKVVFLAKPRRSGHILTKNFRSISLSSFLLKTLERLVDRLIKSTPLLERFLANSQHAYKKDRSTETALHHLLSGMEIQLEAKGYAPGYFLDIEGAFDSTSNRIIREVSIRHEIPEVLIDWMINMLAGRRLTVNYENETLEGCPAGGCPQGGVLSPTL